MFRILIVLALFAPLLASAQRGKIIKPATTTVMDPNQDGFVSKTTAGFSNDGYNVDEFELPMFGIPISGSGDVLADNQAGAKCGITDITVDSRGYGVYGVLDNSDNLIFRFRLGTDNPSVESYTILIDTDGKMGPDDPNATPNNPGFEIDITLIKNRNKGVYIFNIDGIESCPVALRNYGFDSHFQISIADVVSCSNPDYFYDYYVPFSDLATLFGITKSTEMRFVAVTNVSATCAMAGKISDVGGVDDTLYNGCNTCAFLDLTTTQCPTSLSNLCFTCLGFQSGVTPKPTINLPVKAGENFLSGFLKDPNGSPLVGADIVVKVYTSSAQLSLIESKTVVTDVNGGWQATLQAVLAAGNYIAVTGKAIDRCSGGGLGSQATFTIVVINAPPQLAGSVITSSYTENAGPLPVQPGLLIVDPDNVNLATATVSILSNFKPDQDQLVVTPIAGIAALYDNATGVLSLTGSASLSSYQTLLRSLSYINTSENPDPSTRVIQLKVFDGLDFSNLLNRSVAVVPVNDPPVVTGSPVQIQYTTGNLVIDNAVVVSDVDNTLITGATISITNNFIAAEDRLNFTNQLGITGSYNSTTGILTLAGTTTLASYGTALQSISYTNVLVIPTLLTRRISFVATDGASSSLPFDKFIQIVQSNHPPVLVDGSNNPISILPFNTPEDIPLNACVRVFDPDGDPIAIASINIISGSGSFSLSGGLCFGFIPAANFNGLVTATISVCDPDNLCAAGTIQLTVTAVNDPPVVTGSGATNAYSGGSMIVDNTVTVADVDNATIAGATLSIVGNFVAAEDVLNFANQAGIIGTYNAGSGVLSLSGSASVASYTTALESITYSNAILSSLLTRAVSFEVTDGTTNSQPFTKFISFSGNINRPPGLVDGSNNPVSVLNYSTNEDVPIAVCLTAFDPDGDRVTISSFVVTSGSGTLITTGGLCFVFTPATNFTGAVAATVTICDPSNACASGTVNITVAPVNDPPVLTGSASIPVYTTGNLIIDNTLTVADPDNVNLSGATISFTNNFVTAEDQLNFANQLGITGSYTSATGILTLSGTASLASYSTALRSINYSNSNQFPSTLSRKISFVVSDGTNSGNTFDKFLDVTQINVPPVLTDGTNPIDTLYYTINEDTPLNNTCVNAFDSNGDQVNISIISVLTGVGNFALEGGLCFRFVPGSNFNGRVKARITLCDGAINSLCVVAGIVINVLPVDDPPVINSIIFQVNQDATTPICLTVSDPENDLIFFASGFSINANGTATTGSLSTDLCFDYTPLLGFSGIDLVSVTVCETNAPTVCTTKTVSVDVMKVNHPPVILVNSIPGGTINVTTKEDTPIVFCFETVDPDGDNVVLQQTTNIAGGGTLSPYYLGIEFCFTFTPQKDFNGTARWEIKVCDSGVPSLCGVLVALINVTPVNDPPSAVNDTVSVIRNTLSKFNLLANDSDVDGDSIKLNISPITTPGHGLASLSADGFVSYTSDRYYKGLDSMKYEICDSASPSFCSRATVTFVIGDLPLRVYEAVSPNGDGINEYWRIEGIDYYLNNKVQVFDRYNNLVYEMQNYNNEDRAWRGDTNHGLFRGRLPDGVYFYSIELGQGSPGLSGFIVLKKE